MSLAAIVNLAESLLNQPASQETQSLLALAAGATSDPATSTGNSTAGQDQFVPSSQTESASGTAEAAGLFTARQFSLFTPAANSLLAQPAAATQTGFAAAPEVAQVPAGTASNNVEPAAINGVVTVAAAKNLSGGIVGNANGGTATSALAQGAAPAGATTNTSSNGGTPTTALSETAALSATANAALTNATSINATVTNGGTTSAPNALTVREHLQTLNNSLAALGLSASDIQKVDQIADAINNFNPTTFRSLVYQLEGLAQNASSQTAQTTAVSHNAANAPTAAQPETTTNANATNAATSATSSTKGANFALQGVQLQLTFANNNGQTLQVQTAATSPAAAQTKAAAA